MLREFDIIILGATGYTGRLIARYLEKHPERSKIKYAIAGRSVHRLNDLANELNLDQSKVVIIGVNIGDYEELESLVKRTRLVINCVGPFALYSTPVVRACAQTATHYTDITGEAHWILKIIREFDFLATKNKAIIIPASGFDSVPRYIRTLDACTQFTLADAPSLIHLPSDLSVYLSVRTAKRTFGPATTLSWSRTGVYMAGNPSGGTLATMLSTVDGSISKADVIASQKSWALSPIKGEKVPKHFVYTLPFTKWVGGKSLMEFVNIPIVERTWGLNEVRHNTLSVSSSPHAKEEDKLVPYAGPNFTYEEFGQTLKLGQLGAWFWSIGIAILLGSLMYIPPMRWLVRKFGPAPGTGPSDGTLSKGFVNLTNVSKIEVQPPRYVKSEMTWKGSGYLITAIACVEASLSILLDFDKLPKLGQEGGILTPMSALGDVLVDRLERTGRLVQDSGIVSEAETSNKKTV